MRTNSEGASGIFTDGLSPTILAVPLGVIVMVFATQSNARYWPRISRYRPLEVPLAILKEISRSLLSVLTENGEPLAINSWSASIFLPRSSLSSDTGRRVSRASDPEPDNESSTGIDNCWLNGISGYKPPAIHEICMHRPSGALLQVCAA